LMNRNVRNSAAATASSTSMKIGVRTA